MAATIRHLVEALQRMLRPSISGRKRDLLPNRLFHYTGAVGFEAIVRTKSLRATNFSFMNDPSEVEHALGVIQKVFDGERSNQLGEPLPWFFDRVQANLNIELLSETYLVCFTGLRDDLSQWRAYGSASAERYAIGFDSEILRRIVRSRKNCRFVRVVYDPSDQEARVRAIVVKATAFLRQHAVSRKDIEPFAELVAEHLARLLPLLKSPEYHAEDEWRIAICRPSSDLRDVECDTSRGVLRPFVTFAFPARPHLPVSEVIVLAPSRPARALKAATVVLRRARILEVPPRHSRIPFAD